MAGRLSIYVIPFVMVFIEMVMRSALSVDTKAFIGPTIASVGIALLLPLTRPEKVKRDPLIPTELYEVAEAQEYELRPRRESRFIEWTWFLVVVSLAIWIWTLYESIKFPRTTLGPPIYVSKLVIGPLPTYDDLGVICYLIGVAMTEVRERLGKRTGDAT